MVELTSREALSLYEEMKGAFKFFWLFSVNIANFIAKKKISGPCNVYFQLKKNNPLCALSTTQLNKPGQQEELFEEICGATSMFRKVQTPSKPPLVVNVMDQ